MALHRDGSSYADALRSHYLSNAGGAQHPTAPFVSPARWMDRPFARDMGLAIGFMSQGDRCHVQCRRGRGSAVTSHFVVLAVRRVVLCGTSCRPSGRRIAIRRIGGGWTSSSTSAGGSSLPSSACRRAAASDMFGQISVGPRAGHLRAVRVAHAFSGHFQSEAGLGWTGGGSGDDPPPGARVRLQVVLRPRPDAAPTPSLP